LADANAMLERSKQWSNLSVLDGAAAAKLLEDQKTILDLIRVLQVYRNQAARFDKAVLDMVTASAKVWGTLYPDVCVASPFHKYLSTSLIPGPLNVNESNSSQIMAVVRG
jgi:hypothetical protein